MIEPRFAWVPPRSRSLGPDAVAFWEAAGGRLFDWQKAVIDGMFGLDADGRWASSEDGLAVARQNGKGVVLQVVEAFCAFELGYLVVMHTAHEFATSQEHQFRLEDMIQNCPHLHTKVKDTGGYKHANGQESINLKSGCRIIFKARTKMGARGYSGDLLVWDEAMVVPDTVVGSMLPMLRASTAAHGPKVIYAGSAVDQEVHEYGVNFARIRERGIGRAPRVSYHEWSAPFDHPSQLTHDLMRNRELWPAGNPSMPDGLVSADYMADEVERMAPRTAAVELFDVGDWPDVDESASGLFDMKRWAALAGGVCELEEPSLAVDVSPVRTNSTIAAACSFGEKVRVSVVARDTGTGWIVPRLVELTDELRPARVVVDERGPAASLLPEMEAAGLKVTVLNTSEYTRACGGFFDAVEQATVEHDGHPALDAAVRGAAQRSLGDAWAWSRKHSKADITPLVACTIAHWAEATTPAATDPQWVFA